MISDVSVLDADLDEGLKRTETTTAKIDALGQALANESYLLGCLRHALERNADQRFDLMEVMLRPQRTPLGEDRRLALEGGIVEALPRFLANKAA